MYLVWVIVLATARANNSDWSLAVQMSLCEMGACFQVLFPNLIPERVPLRKKVADTPSFVVESVTKLPPSYGEPMGFS